MADALRPRDEADLVEIVQAAVASEAPLELIAGGTKRGFGRPGEGRAVDLSGLAGVTMYEPSELVMTVRPGTPMSEIEGLLGQNRQQLAFEPADLGPLFGVPAGRQTLGGVLATNLSGPRRIKAGAARDHFLGFRGVGGRGEAFKSGGRVVKNVTGYDLSKLMAGSFGTLAALTEVTVKVHPAPEKLRTVLLFGLDEERAVAALAQAAGSPHEVSGLAHLPAAAAKRSKAPYVVDAGASVTAVRVEGPGPSVEHRCRALRDELKRFGASEELHGMNSARFWQEVRDVAPLLPEPEAALWRLSVTPSEAPRLLRELGPADWFADWAGGLLWLAEPQAEPEQVRRAVGAHGHATLVRGPEAARRAAFQPQPAALAALTRRVKESFDPLHLLNRGRMYEDV
jgi:glycolate oxidase FAD binding subunit